jgi:hypothetical protein
LWKALDHFNTFVASDPRVDVTMLPLFDGVSQIKWKVGIRDQIANKANGMNETDRIKGH